MTLLTTDTTITYPDGATTSTGTVIHVELLCDGLSVVLVDTTAFHPPARRTHPTGIGYLAKRRQRP